MTKKEFKKLRSRLPRGYVRALAEETGTSLATVVRALRGDSPNMAIVDAAIKMAASYQEMIRNQESQINSL